GRDGGLRGEEAARARAGELGSETNTGRASPGHLDAQGPEREKSLHEAHEASEKWLREYNDEQPHQPLEGPTSFKFFE
ncbi:MAG: transposase, partial [Deltaproteobacteria bacterium]|nr:transposase [Deltaproteobacteria bacterium]